MLGFSIHLQFIESWQKLSKSEQDSVHRLLQMLEDGHVTPGMRPHRVGQFLSLSPNMDLRVIALSLRDMVTLLYVGHHDDAYEWARQKSIFGTEFGITELIKIPEVLGKLQKPLHNNYALPIPIKDVLDLDNDDLFLGSISSMSPEWQEWLLSAYKNDETRTLPPTGSSLVFCPTNDEELVKALKLDIPAWQLFLHPVQRQAIDDLQSKSIVIFGGPGTGKTAILLNRLINHAPKGKDQGCFVLMTYSAGLASYLIDLLGPRTTRYFYVFPMYFLGGKVPSHTKEATVFRKFRLFSEQGQLVLWNRDGTTRPVDELLIDEFQDIPAEVAYALQPIILSGLTRVVLATDSNQSIHRLNQKDVNEVIQLCEKQYELTYCYRSTHQIIQKARKWLDTFDLDISSNEVFGLSGPSVRFVAASNLDEQLQITAEVMRDLNNRYKSSEIAVVFCQYYNPSFNKASKEEEALKSHPDTKNHYHFASKTKGKEFFAGVLFVSKSFLEREVGEEPRKLRINTLYVALTRFRDEVTVVYTEGCAVESQLEQLSRSV